MAARSPLSHFTPAARAWFEASFEAPTAIQAKGWATVAAGEHTLMCAPTGSGKTLAAVLWSIDRLSSEPAPPEIARFLGGSDRAVSIVDVGQRKQLEVRVEVPVEDMAQLERGVEMPPGSASAIGDDPGGPRRSIWPAIHPRLLELIREHRSTIVFVNSRRMAERLANKLNELAGEELVRAHHGSIAREQRVEVEDALKPGRLPGIVATS